GLLRRPLARRLVHRNGQLDAHLRIHVADRAPLRIGQAQTAQPDLGAVLRLGRHLELDLAALDRRRGDLAPIQRDAQRHRNRHSQVLAFAREDRIRCNLDGRPKTRHPKHRAFLHARRHLDLDAPAAGQLHRPAGAGEELGEADCDRQLDIDWLLAHTPPRVAEDRPEDVAETPALAEEILHLLWADRPVLRAGTHVGAKSPSAWLDTGGRGAGPVLAELVVELSLL